MNVPARSVPAVPEPPEAPGGAGTLERARRLPRSPAPPPPPATSPRRNTRRRKHHVGFVVLASIVVGSMVLGIASLNALLAQTSFRIDTAERRIDELSQERLELIRVQAQLSAPGRIAAWALRNGMRLPDDIRPLHAPGDPSSAPAGAADTLQTPGDGT